MSRRPSSPRARAGATTPRRPGARTTTRVPGARRDSTGPARPAVRAPHAPAAEGGEDEARTLHLVRLLSVRALVLGIVLLAGFSMLFPTIRAYLGQRAELQALAAEVAAAEHHQEELQAELARWDDEAYVAAQARGRLGYVFVGETPYYVMDPEVVVEAPALEGSAPGSVAGPALPVGGSVSPWYVTVWDSVQIAGEAPVVDPGAAR